MVVAAGKEPPAVIDGLRPRKPGSQWTLRWASGIRTLGPYRIGNAGNAEQNRPDKWVHLHGGPRVRIRLPPAESRVRTCFLDDVRDQQRVSLSAASVCTNVSGPHLVRLLLPQPDSPTNPKVRPGCISNPTPSTALIDPAFAANQPPRTGKCLVTPSTAMTGGSSPSSQFASLTTGHPRSRVENPGFPRVCGRLVWRRDRQRRAVTGVRPRRFVCLTINLDDMH
jgi:hypothetical protein